MSTATLIPSTADQELVQQTVKVRRGVWRELKIEAIRQDEQLQDLLGRIITDYLSD